MIRLATLLERGRVFQSAVCFEINFSFSFNCMNGTTSMPKSVLRYSVDKVRQVSESEVCYSDVSFVQNLKFPINGIDVTILTSLNETNAHCYLSMEYLRNW